MSYLLTLHNYLPNTFGFDKTRASFDPYRLLAYGVEIIKLDQIGCSKPLNEKVIWNHSLKDKNIKWSNTINPTQP